MPHRFVDLPLGFVHIGDVSGPRVEVAQAQVFDRPATARVDLDTAEIGLLDGGLPSTEGRASAPLDGVESEVRETARGPVTPSAPTS